MSDPKKSVNRQIATGAFWTVLMRMGIRFLGLISVIILARILVPEDFGVVAKASMIASFLDLITQFGLETALIHNQSTKSEHYNTVWTIHVIRGVVVAVVLTVLAGPAAEFLNEPALAVVLLFYALSAILIGFENIGVVDFRKELNFDRDFRFNIIKKLTGFIVTIAVAVAWESYWAFVVGSLSVSSAGLIASFRMSKYRPRLDLSEWRSLFHFSKWIFIGSIVSSIAIKLDTFVLSRFSTTETVGQYTVADEIAGAASTELAMPIARATMPGLAKLSNDQKQFQNTYTQTILLVLLVAIPAGAGLSALAEPITYVVLGDKWKDAAILIKILAIYGIVRAIYSMSASAFMASGAVKSYAILAIVNLLFRGLTISIGYYFYGVVGLALGVLVASVAYNATALFVQQSLGFVKLIDVCAGIWRVLLAAIIMYLSVTKLWDYFFFSFDPNTAATLFLRVAWGTLTYTFFLVGLWLLSRDRRGPEANIIEFVSEKWSDRVMRKGVR